MNKASMTIDPFLANQGEQKNFVKTALTWQGSVTPRVLPRVVIVLMYAIAVEFLIEYFGFKTLPVSPFEYSGAVLALLLVLRVNAGLDRWWEARKIWGSIVNQSRNLGIIGAEYAAQQDASVTRFLKWVASWPHVMRESLRRESVLGSVVNILGETETAKIRAATHMPTYVASQIAKLLKELRNKGMDDFSFQAAEKQRGLLIDAIGACERIRNTPIPLVLAIKVRRFIFLFVLLLPFALAHKLGWATPLICALASYPLFSLDEIGAELQNPFSPRNLSHLPLYSICKTIENNVLSLANAEVEIKQNLPRPVSILEKGVPVHLHSAQLI